MTSAQAADLLRGRRAELEHAFCEAAARRRAVLAVLAKTAASVLYLEADRLVTEARIRDAIDDVLSALTCVDT